MQKYIHSIIDLDLYKLTQQNFALKLFPREYVRYDFINRDHRPFPKGFDSLLQKAVDSMTDLTLNQEGYEFMKRKCYYLDQSYLDFLKGYRLDPNEVLIKQDGEDLKVRVEGLWYRAILWETILMSIISEIYFEEMEMPPPARNTLVAINANKAQIFHNNDIHFVDFGTRRRFSFHNHVNVISDMMIYGREHFMGTSNVYLAQQFDQTPIGTAAHELFSLMAAIYGFNMANTMAMEKWVEVYGGDLGIVLPDTFTSDVFLKSFNTKHAKLWDGARQDSGNPIEFADKFIEHYKKLRIDPMSKTIVFSDALNTEKVLKIEKHCKGKIKTSYGIGTFLTNDIPDVKPLNIVIKLTGRKTDETWMPTVKLSDDLGKHTGDPEMIELCKKTLMIKDK
jgi:nicotinate phosphoribosyltransferase